MTIRSVAFSFIAVLCFGSVKAQQPTDELVKINQKTYTVDDFERVYTKNLDLIKDEEQKNIDNYMNLFVLYKLKIDRAYALELDKDPAYISELASNRKQLAQKYFTDEKKLDHLAEEAYQRSLTEREASHILFKVGEFASPEDTLKVYHKAMEVYAKIQQGMPFSEAAVKYSEDQSVVQNKGYLGYFSVFRMVYPFESGAYNTPVGSVSKPVRSQFGYHLIDVTNERPVRYFRNISQILIPDSDENPNTTAKTTIDAIYEQLQKGVSFESLMQEYQTQDFMGTNKGVTQKFYPGLLNIQGIDDQVYALKQVGDYSKPFKSQLGWHIVKINEIDDFPSFEENKMNLIQKITTDSRSQVMQKDLLQHLKNRFQYKEFENEKKKAFSYISDKIYQSEWVKPKTKSDSKAMATFGDQKITTGEFLEFVDTQNPRYLYVRPVGELSNVMFNQLVTVRLSKYYDERLEKDFPDFKNTMQEYREGLLLFELMEKDIWEKSRQDTLGYTKYFQDHAQTYATQNQFKGVIAMYKSEKQAQKALRYFKKKQSVAEMIKKYNPEVWQEGVLDQADERVSQVFPVKAPYQTLHQTAKGVAVLLVDEIIPSKVPEWEEVKTRVLQDYQEAYEKQWSENLKKDAQIQINTPVLQQLKAKYSQN